jgi:3-isopropylmalate/(R)-2-methylmalate dehydratase large subunit
MAVEAGAKNGVIAPDEKTVEYARAHGVNLDDSVLHQSDDDAGYFAEYECDVSGMVPLVAYPHQPANVREVGNDPDLRIDQVVIGSCTNGRMDDLRAAAEILRGRTVAPHVRAIVIPGTQAIYRQAMAEGLIEVFLSAGAAVSTPTCGPCFGGHMGILADGERAVSTTNRNFTGRMGSPSSEVYLAGPPVAAASAVAGRLAHPGEVQ